MSWKAAFAGAAFAAITWEIAKKALAVYLLKPNHGLYGDLGNLIVFILWILYSMTILLLGAEVSAGYAEVVEGAPAARLKRAAHATPSADASTPVQLGPGPRQGARPRPPHPQDRPEGRPAVRAAVTTGPLAPNNGGTSVVLFGLSGSLFLGRGGYLCLF